LRNGAQEMLGRAIEDEVASYVGDRKHVVDEAGRRLVVRNGHLPERSIQTPMGEIAVKQPHVRDRRDADKREGFQSSILPPYLCKAKSLEDLLPWLYLKGISRRLQRSAPGFTWTDFSLDMCGRVWVDNYGKQFARKLEMTELIYNTLKKSGIEIPFPTRTVYMKQ
jgi:hypothetical protein